MIATPVSLKFRWRNDYEERQHEHVCRDKGLIDKIFPRVKHTTMWKINTGRKIPAGARIAIKLRRLESVSKVLQFKSVETSVFSRVCT